MDSAAGVTAARPIPPELHKADANPTGSRLALLTLTALGVVYGDIGTSPLYALRECFKPEYGIAASPENVYGVLSLIVWSLTLVVSVKYIVYVMRADNRGEGGILAMLALILDKDTVMKISHGGWVPMAIAIGIFTLMTTWERGRAILRERLTDIAMPLPDFLRSLSTSSIPRVPGTAVFMTGESGGAPVVLLHHLKHNKALHAQVILLSIQTSGVPEEHNSNRLTIERLEHGFVRVVARYGFMESPDVKEVMELLRRDGIRSRPLDTSYYLGRELLIPFSKPWRKGGLSMNIWRKKLFVLMAKNARSAAEFFQLPPNRVVELGTQIEF